MNIYLNAIGTLCLQLHPESVNELEAVDNYRKQLYRLVQIKLTNNISAAQDIEFYFLLGKVYDHFYSKQILDHISSKNNGGMNDQ